MKKTILISLIVVLVVAGIGYFLKQHQEEQQAAQKVYNEVKQGLLMISKEYNKGVEKVELLQQYEEAKLKIIKEDPK
ncbi:hypothetical protein [Capnocytophaga sputigena]|jgi:hypothetical protein|uniref:hypothetical protein n=1 Tax=Capnocytophaga sputigena TaxID=1019 RepID=UPI0028E83F0C|nr:hypothetical protein [Capnocytophaga sputigena]